jgi:hypothetical protein
MCVPPPPHVLKWGREQSLSVIWTSWISKIQVYHDFAGRDSSVGIATRYGLDGPWIESPWGRDFSHPSRPALGPTQPPIQWVPGLSTGGKLAGTKRWPPTPSSAEVQERVDLYFYSPSGPSSPVLGWNVPLPLPWRYAVSPGRQFLDFSNDDISFIFNIETVRISRLARQILLLASTGVEE